MFVGSGGLVVWFHAAAYAGLASWAPLYRLGGSLPEVAGIVLLGLVGAALQSVWLVPAEVARRYELRPVGWGLALGAFVSCVVHLVRIGDELVRTVF